MCTVTEILLHLLNRSGLNEQFDILGNYLVSCPKLDEKISTSFLSFMARLGKLSIVTKAQFWHIYICLLTKTEVLKGEVVVFTGVKSWTISLSGRTNFLTF